MLFSNPTASAYMFANYNTGYTPTVYFDGGHSVFVGGSSVQSNYTSRILTASTRAVSPLKLAVKLNFISTSQLSVEYFVKTSNEAPPVPAQVTGASLVRTDQVHTYVADILDTEGDLIFCRWIFDKDDTTAWYGPYQSGDTSMVSHSWPVRGNYDVSVQTKDYWDIQPTGSTPLVVQAYLCGDANDTGTLNISDAVFIINYIFGGGAAPSPEISGDSNCTGSVNISDAVYLINFIFGGGTAPCFSCP